MCVDGALLVFSLRCRICITAREVASLVVNGRVRYCGAEGERHKRRREKDKLAYRREMHGGR